MRIRAGKEEKKSEPTYTKRNIISVPLDKIFFSTFIREIVGEYNGAELFANGAIRDRLQTIIWHKF